MQSGADDSFRLTLAVLAEKNQNNKQGVCMPLFIIIIIVVVTDFVAMMDHDFLQF